MRRTGRDGGGGRLPHWGAWPSESVWAAHAAVSRSAGRAWYSSRRGDVGCSREEAAKAGRRGARTSFYFSGSSGRGGWRRSRRDAVEQKLAESDTGGAAFLSACLTAATREENKSEAADSTPARAPRCTEQRLRTSQFPPTRTAPLQPRSLGPTHRICSSCELQLNIHSKVPESPAHIETSTYPSLSRP
ncbi:hypothetical protein BU23DRAFT_215351 [Bimuria novae-zelandiae CBS 107.79]|uniref:Uncharacterized protein n=1 Tax=Bimuria novae-zelandiae CBS 107.79 TaxID=1447943 RepID=A0A6A5V0C4_9PLEO|nr:hypothetical protein BU23DRAFT_215351 [Bimuria novae-zelandiae CBS 107.79]